MNLTTTSGGFRGRIPTPQPYDEKCSNQEGVKVGRPTPYIGAPSDVNFKKISQCPESQDFKGLDVLTSRPLLRASSASTIPSGWMFVLTRGRAGFLRNLDGFLRMLLKFMCFIFYLKHTRAGSYIKVSTVKLN